MLYASVNYAPTNVKPEGGGGGGTPGICGAFDLFCLPHPREFDLESGPQGGDVCFFFARFVDYFPRITESIKGV